MLKMWYLSSLNVQLPLLKSLLKIIWTEDYVAETFYIATMIMWSDYKNKCFNVILDFLDTLRTPNYTSEGMLMKSSKIHTGLHKHHFYLYRTDFAMKRGHSACATTPLNAAKLVMLQRVARFLCK